MRIAHVSDCYLPRLGGIERQVHDLATWQHLAGHQVEIITSAGATDDDRVEAAFRVHRLAAGAGAGAIGYSSSLRGARLLADRRFDAVHVHLSTFSPLAFLTAWAACAAGVPVAATVHSMWAGATPLIRASSVALGWRRWPIAWSAVSTVAADGLSGVLPGRPISVIPNGVVADQWRVPVADRDPDRVVIASVMRLTARKRPRQLLRMLARVRRHVPDGTRIEALIIGDGPLRRRLEADLRSLGLADWVRLTGALDHDAIRDVYRDCDVYVAPAKLESFGIAALEASAAGVPVVAHADTGVADFVIPGVTGLLVDGDDSMVAALSRLVREPGLRATLAAHSRAHPPPVGWPGVLAGCQALYARAIGMRAAGAGHPVMEAAR